MFRRWWDTCVFTRELRLRGSRGNETAILSLHSTGRYRLRKRSGATAVDEVGSFTRRYENFNLTADAGWLRRLVALDGGGYRVLENDVAADHVIEDWVLEPRGATHVVP